MDIPRYALIATRVLLGLMLLGEWTHASLKNNEPQRYPLRQWLRQRRDNFQHRVDTAS